MNILIGLVVLLAAMVAGSRIRPKQFNTPQVRLLWLAALVATVVAVLAGGFFAFVGIAIFGVLHGMLGRFVPRVPKNRDQ